MSIEIAIALCAAVGLFAYALVAMMKFFHDL